MGNRISVADRFWMKVDQRGTAECWEWTASRNPKGYGMFRWRQGESMWLAHRAAYVLATGVDPRDDGLEVDHTCRNRGCVNPAHLRPVTHKQNSENRARRQGGVSRRPYGRWRARVGHNGRTVHVGEFGTEAEAREAARLARLELFTHNEIDRRNSA